MPPSSPAATRSQTVPASLDALPAGSLVTVVAAAGYGKSRLARQWAASGPRRVLVEIQPEHAAGEALRHTIADALGRQGGPPLIVLDAVERLGPRAGEILDDLIGWLPPATVLAVLGRELPDLPEQPSVRGRRLRLTQTHLALGPLGPAERPWDEWPSEARRILVEDAFGWPAAVPLIADQLERQQDSGLDPALLRHALTARVGTVLDAVLGAMDPGQLRLISRLAAVTPATTDQLVHLFGPDTLAALDRLVRAPVPMVSKRDDRWAVAPLLREVLLARDPEIWGARMALNLDLAHRSAEDGDLMGGLQRMRALGSSGGLARYVGRWSVVEALRGYPETALQMLREFGPDELSRDPDLLLARAMTDTVNTDLPSVAHWLNLLEHHHDVAAPLWSSTHPLTTAALREATGIHPVGAGTRAGLSAGLPWVGLAHVVMATDALCRGAFDEAEGVLTVLRTFAPDFPLIGGWRVALLIPLLLRTERIEDAVRTYRRVSPDLEASDFARQRITFFLDSSMARAACHAGDREQASRLMARSLDKTAEIRAGGFTTRLLVYLNNAETAEWLGNRAVMKAALDAADELVPYASGAPALAAEVGPLRARALRQSEAPVALTTTQLRVLAHLAGPYTVPRIAQSMFVSASTVRTHIRHLYAALEVGTRGAAVDRARELGLID